MANTSSEPVTIFEAIDIQFTITRPGEHLASVSLRTRIGVLKHDGKEMDVSRSLDGVGFEIDCEGLGTIGFDISELIKIAGQMLAEGHEAESCK